MNDYTELLGEDYDRLYAKYLIRPSRLLVAPDPAVALNEHTRLLDLCSGSGAVVKAAIEMGVKADNIVAVEASETMIVSLSKQYAIWRGQASITVVHATVDYGRIHGHLHEHGLFDLITCRQAVNYWWAWGPVQEVLRSLAPGGCFVFNTFNTKPADVPQTKQYIHDGKQFAEIAYCIGDRVHHVQAREGIGMHATTFQWVEPEEFAAPLDALKESGALDSWNRIREGTTDTYVVRANGS